jgi:hypothetical protein
LVLSAETPAEAQALELTLPEIRDSGELQETNERMRLE